MIRKIIHIDQDKCNGCGACAAACHEGAIAMVQGKAVLTKEHHCDGLGDCLPACPTGAITFEEREAPAYDAQAVARAKAAHTAPAAAPTPGSAPASESALENWPVQLKLVPPGAPFLDGASLLIAADCSAFAYGSFHADFLKGRAALIGCPKLDAVDYSEKLSAILTQNDIRSITVTRMEVPCCGGLDFAVRKAIAASGKSIPLTVVTISAEGEILSTQQA